MADRPPLVVLVIASRDRPAGLDRLLSALRAVCVPQCVRWQIAVVDNSATGSAAPVVSAQAPHHRALHYISQRQPGLSRARNAGLEYALAEGAAFLGFIDDDEVPDPDWLAAHLRVLARTGAGASLGPVVAGWQAPPPRWVREGGFLEIRGHGDGAPMPFGATSNTVIDLTVVRRLQLRFDPAYDRTGGEDTVFFAALMQGGGQVVFAAGAPVVEAVPAERMTLSWHWQRWRRTGQTGGEIWIGARPARRLPCVAGGALRLALGAALALATAPVAAVGRPVPLAKSARLIARGLGFVDAAFGRRSELYGARSPERVPVLAAETPQATTRNRLIS